MPTLSLLQPSGHAFIPALIQEHSAPGTDIKDSPQTAPAPRKVVTVIMGTGQGALSVSRKLQKAYETHCLDHIDHTIHVVTENEQIGGTGFPKDSKNWLNAFAKPMLIPDGWIERHSDELIERGLLKKNEAGYGNVALTRGLYQAVMEDQTLAARRELAQHASLQVHNGNPAVDIDEENGKAILTLKNGDKIKADFVFWTIGGYEAKIRHELAAHPSVLSGAVKFIPSAYEADKLAQAIEPGEPVTIFGSRLGAIDAHDNPGGHITIVSRTGALSPIKPDVNLALTPLQAFTFERLEALRADKKLSAETISALIQEEADLQWKQVRPPESPEHISIAAFRNPFRFTAAASPAAFTAEAYETLRRDFDAASNDTVTENKFLYSLFVKINPTVLDLVEREWIPPEHHAVALDEMTWPAAMPLPGAKRLLDKMAAQTVTLFPGVEKELGTDSETGGMVMHANWPGADGSPQLHALVSHCVVDATGGYNGKIRDPEKSATGVMQIALQKGLNTAYKRPLQDGSSITLGGVDLQPATGLSVGPATMFNIGSYTLGRTGLSPSGTVGRIDREADQAVATMVSMASLPMAKMDREEVFAISNQCFRHLSELLTGEKLRTNGKIEELGLTLYLPSRLEGEPIFSLSEAAQYVVFAGLSWPEDGAEIAHRDKTIREAFEPGKPNSPLCYYSKKVTTSAGDVFWLNIVLFSKPIISATTGNRKVERNRWTAPDAKYHADTVAFARQGSKDKPPAFPEVHFIYGQVDAEALELKPEEHRLSINPETASKGGVTVERQMKTLAAGTRWMKIRYDETEILYKPQQTADLKRNRDQDGEDGGSGAKKGRIV